MKIGSDVPEVTWTELRCVLRLGIARPSTRPSAIAKMIHTGRNRSRNDRRVDDRLDVLSFCRRQVGGRRCSRESSRSGGSAVQQHEDEPAAASTGSGRVLQHADSPGAADRSWPAGISVSESTV